ncbi:MAG: PEGA domain-containing protein, partial [Burkholderiales bacterium]
FVAMSLRDAFAPDPDSPPKVPARIGCNLGPVRLVRDLNGQPNIIGDGINVAQRVMGFAKAGQVLVSRSYYEVVSHISEGYGQLFRYEGSRTDKHVREHEIYSIGYSAAHSTLKSPAERARASSREQARQSATASMVGGNLLAKIEPWLNNRSIAYGTATFSVAAFSLALLLNFFGSAPQAEEVVGQPSTPAATAKTITNGSNARDTGLFTVPKGAEKKRAAVPTANGADSRKKASPFPLLSATDEAQPATAKSAGTAVIALAIAPWGEVFVDGNRIGVSPPVNEVEVAPGRRKIEIRNSGFPVYSQVVEVKADEKIRIKHKFN